MSALPPIVVRYEGAGEFRCRYKRTADICDKHLVIGEKYTLAEYEERSGDSHKHYFATIREAWLNLPETMAGRFPSEEHLRKWCLVKVGHCDQDQIVLESDMDALAVAAYARRRDGYAVVSVSGNVVTTYTARSQDKQSQSRKEFGETKDKIFQVLSELLGTDVTSLSQANAA